MTHIVFNESDVKVLNEAIALDETGSMNGDVVLIRDDYAVGPLYNCYIGEGIQHRRQWWQDVLAAGDYEGKADAVDDYKTIAELVGTLRRNEEEEIWIWAAQNKHDVCGYYWLLHYFKEFQGRIQILYLNNLPFFNDKGNIFYPSWLSEIPAKEFLKAKKLAREITLSEFEVDPDEWTKLCNENKGVRLLEGGKKLIQHDYDYYDQELKKFVTAEWQKAAKIIQQFLSKSKETTGDAFLLWRIKVLLAQDLFDVQGKVEGMKDFEIKWKG
jgi:hypothetical protein